jgi:hypothetical protein
MSKPEEKYAKEKEYSGNCPFLRANKEKYWEEQDALREKEKAEGEIDGKAG